MLGFDPYIEALTSFRLKLDARWRTTPLPAPQITWLLFSREGIQPAMQGWKIHVSAAASEAARLLAVIAPILIRRAVSFKLPETLAAIELLNAGEAGETQIGKVVTVYPPSDEDAMDIAIELDAIWHDTMGPAIPTDLCLRPGGAVGLRYGTIAGKSYVVDSSGLRQSALTRPDGVLVPDHRSPGRFKPRWQPRLPIRGYVDAKRFGEVVAIARRQVLPLALLHHSAKGEVQLGVDLGNGSTCILKTARRGVAGDRGGHDAQTRLANEFRVLRQLQAVGCAVGPRAFGVRSGDVAMLMLEDIDGVLLTSLDRSKQGAAIASLAAAIDCLHRHQFAHRDVKPSNAVATESGVRLIDFELAAPFGTINLPLARTRGYRDDEKVVSPLGDRLALAATLFAIVSGCDPATLPEGRGRLAEILMAIGRLHDRRVFLDLINPDLLNRTLEEIVACPHTTPVGTSSKEAPLRRWAMRASREAAEATRSFRRHTPETVSWTNNHIQYQYALEGINIGAAGVLLGLLTVDAALRRKDFLEDIDRGSRWLIAREPTLTHAGLFTGFGGVALALTLAGRRLTKKDLVAKGISAFRRAAELVHGSDLFSGAAGIVWLATLLTAVTGDESPLAFTQTLVTRLLKSVQRMGAVPAWPAARYLRETSPLLGAAHGSSGIAMALALWGRAAGRKAPTTLATETFRAIARAKLPDGWPRNTNSETAHHSPGDWCHGAAGILWCLLHAFDSDETFDLERAALIQTLLQVIPVRNGTFCHGLAGQLDLWRMIEGLSPYERDAALQGARIAAVLRATQQRRKNGTVWSSEEATVITPDLWVGFLGPAAGLAMYAARRRESIMSVSWFRRASEAA